MRSGPGVRGLRAAASLCWPTQQADAVGEAVRRQARHGGGVRDRPCRRPDEGVAGLHRRPVAADALEPQRRLVGRQDRERRDLRREIRVEDQVVDVVHARERRGRGRRR